MSTSQFLQKPNIAPAAEFVAGALWQDLKRCLNERRPEAALTTDTADTAAAKGHQRRGFELCIEAIETIPFDAPSEPDSPFNRPAVQETAD